MSHHSQIRKKRCPRRSQTQKNDVPLSFTIPEERCPRRSGILENENDVLGSNLRRTDDTLSFTNNYFVKNKIVIYML